MITRLLRLVLILFLLLLPFSVRAQENPDFPLPPLEPITAENADRLVQVGRLGNGVVRGLAWSPDGSTLAIATSLGVWVHNAENPDNPPVLLEMDAGGSSVAASNTLIAAGSDDGTIRVWDIETREQRAVLEVHLYYVGSLTFSADGTLLASGDNSGIVRLWDVETMGELKTLSVSNAGAIVELAFDSTDEILYFGTNNGAEEENSLLTWTWNFMTNEEPSSRIQIWDIDYPRFTAGSGLMSINGYEGTVTAETHEVNGERVVLNTPTSYPIILSFGRGSHHLLAGYHNNLSFLWSLERGAVITMRSGSQAEVTYAPILSPNAFFLALGGNDGIVRLIDAETGEERAQLHGHIRAGTGVAFSPNGRLIASGSLDRTIQIWDVETALANPDTPALMTLEGHTSGVTSVTFNHEGTLLASASYDGTIRLWGVPEV